RIVEDEARRVVLVEQGGSVFRRELLLLVGGKGARVLVGGDQIIVARQEIRAVRHPLDRIVLPQRAIGRVGVFVKFGRQLLEIEARRQLSCVSIHPVTPTRK